MASLFTNIKPNPVAVTELLLEQLHVKVNSGTLQQTLEDHPEYPSLLAISDCLAEWQVPNQAYQIEKSEFDADEMEFPFIAHCNNNGGSFMLAHEIAGAKVVYSDENDIRAVMPEAEFLKKWSGIALHATASEKSGELNYHSNRLKERFNAVKIPLLILVLLAAIFLSINYQTLTTGYALTLLLKLTGIAVSVLLLTHSIDVNNPLVKNLCSLGKKNNCNAILKSDAAKVTSWLSWSEVGFFYFTGSFLCLLFNPGTLPLLAWLNILALPYTVYSISYQYREKNWCVLCCTVQGLLWLEFLTTISFKFPEFPSFGLFDFNLLSFSFGLSVLTIICFFVPILSWSVLKSFLLAFVQFKPLKQQLKKFKYNSELFSKVLTSQPRYAVPDDLMPVILGNPDAETTITMVSNPFCGPCAKAHAILDQWLQFRDDIKVKVIFTTTDHDDDEQTKVARHVTALSLLNDSKLVENALNDWYKQSSKKYENWAAKYPVSFNGEMTLITKNQKDWCDLTEITFTPTILVNGYKLPEPYILEDIKYLLT